MHHPIWNYDLPNVPILVDVTVDGEAVPMVIQTTKQGLTFAFNRETGEPVWPIEERAVPQSVVPGEQLSPTQPFPTKPAPLNPLGLSEENVIDFTPALKQEALEIMSQYRIGGPYMPPLPDNHTESVRGWVGCSGGLNITHPAVLDPETGFLYQSSGPGCSGRTVQPGTNVDAGTHGCTASEGDCTTTGATVSDWVAGSTGIGWGGPQGLPINKPPYSKITAIDMNTGEHVFDVAIGDTPQAIRRHPALQGVDLGNTGGRARAIMHAHQDPAPRDGRRAGLGGSQCPRQADRRKAGEHRAPGARSVRHDELHARGQAVHHRADRTGRDLPRLAGGVCSSRLVVRADGTWAPGGLRPSGAHVCGTDGQCVIAYSNTLIPRA